MEYKLEPLISVVVPVFNLESYIADCMRSILAQRYQNIELIVVDDGSQDASFLEISEIADTDARVRIIRQNNAGVAAARWRGLSAATGEYVTFVDGDDYVHPMMYEILMRELQRNKVQVVGCNMVEWDGLQKIDDNIPEYSSVVMAAHAAMEKLMLSGVVDPSLCTKLFHRDLFSQKEFPVGITNNEDLYAVFRVIQKVPYYVKASFNGYYYRIRKGSASRGGIQRRVAAEQQFLVRKKMLKEVLPQYRNIVSCSYFLMIKYHLIFSMKDKYSANERISSTQIREAIFSMEDYLRELPKKTIIEMMFLAFFPKVYYVIRCAFYNLFVK